MTTPERTSEGERLAHNQLSLWIWAIVVVLLLAVFLTGGILIRVTSISYWGTAMLAITFGVITFLRERQKRRRP